MGGAGLVQDGHEGDFLHLYWYYDVCAAHGLNLVGVGGGTCLLLGLLLVSPEGLHHLDALRVFEERWVDGQAMRLLLLMSDHLCQDRLLGGILS